MAGVDTRTDCFYPSTPRRRSISETLIRWGPYNSPVTSSRSFRAAAWSSGASWVSATR